MSCTVRIKPWTWCGAEGEAVISRKEEQGAGTVECPGILHTLLRVLLCLGPYGPGGTVVPVLIASQWTLVQAAQRVRLPREWGGGSVHASTELCRCEDLPTVSAWTEMETQRELTLYSDEEADVFVESTYDVWTPHKAEPKGEASLPTLVAGLWFVVPIESDDAAHLLRAGVSSAFLRRFSGKKRTAYDTFAAEVASTAVATDSGLSRLLEAEAAITELPAGSLASLLERSLSAAPNEFRLDRLLDARAAHIAGRLRSVLQEATEKSRQSLGALIAEYRT